MPSKLPHYALRIPNTTMDKLKYIAEYSGRSANKEIEQLILAHIAKFESEKGSIDLTEFSPKNRQ
jgi:predicted DNA-binding protein